MCKCAGFFLGLVWDCSFSLLYCLDQFQQGVCGFVDVSVSVEQFLDIQLDILFSQFVFLFLRVLISSSVIIGT